MPGNQCQSTPPPAQACHGQVPEDLPVQGIGITRHFLAAAMEQCNLLSPCGIDVLRTTMRELSMRRSNDHVRKRPLGLFAAAILLATGMHTASATEARPAWGDTPGLTTPQPDSKGRAGYWWWPTPNAEGGNTSSGIGNGGRVFGAWKKTNQDESDSSAVMAPTTEGPGEGAGIGRGVFYIMNNILFSFDSDSMTQYGREVADRYIEDMTKYPKKTATFTGHTDDIGPEDYNLALGLRRAQAVKDYMVKHGIAEERISIKSMGESQPVVPNNSPPNRALNRRVEIDMPLAPMP